MLVIIARPTLGVIYVMAALHSIATVFFQPAKTASIPLIVKQEDLLRANARRSERGQRGAHRGAGGGGVAVAAFRTDGEPAGRCGDVSGERGAAAGGRAHPARRARQDDAPKPPRELSTRSGKAGDIWRTTGSRFTSTCCCSWRCICTSIWIPLAPFFIRDHLGGSEHILGWQLGLFGLGAAVGGLIAPRLVEHFGTGVALFAGFLAEAVSLSRLRPCVARWNFDGHRIHLGRGGVGGGRSVLCDLAKARRRAISRTRFFGRQTEREHGDCARDGGRGFVAETTSGVI